MIIPVGALWFLIKDLIKFYFVGNIPEYQERIDENFQYLTDHDLKGYLATVWRDRIQPATTVKDIQSAFADVIEYFNKAADRLGEPRFDMQARLSAFAKVMGSEEKAKTLYLELEAELAKWYEAQKQKEFLPSFIVFATAFPNSVGNVGEPATPATESGVSGSDEVKKRVLRAQYNTRHARFLSSHAHSRAGVASRLLAWISPKDDHNLYDSVPSRTGIEYEEIDGDSLIDQGLSSSDVKNIHKCLSKAGVVDRSLVGEVAFTEMCLVRNALNLRELVLRYAKAVLAVTWTTIISFIIIAALETGCHFQGQWLTNPMLWFSFWYFVWAGFIYSIVTKPLAWIHSLAKLDGQRAKRRPYHEKAMRSFENLVKISAIVAGLCAISATFLSYYGVVWIRNTDGAYLSNNISEFLACPSSQIGKK